MAWGHLENTGLTSGCSRDSWGGYPGKQVTLRPARPSPAAACSHCQASLLGLHVRWDLLDCTGQTGRNTNEPDLCQQPRPRFLQAFGVSVALPHACAAHAPESVVQLGLVISPYI